MNYDNGYVNALNNIRSGNVRDTQANRYRSGLARSLDRYKTMMGALDQAKAAQQAPIASEFGQVADIYKTGGQYGVGAIANLKQNASQNLAASSAAQAASGMSSGSLAMGTRARYSRDLSLGIQGVEDTRYARLGQALTAVAQAKEARGIRIGQAYSQTAQLAQSFQEPTTGQFANQEQLGQQAAATQMHLATQAQAAQASQAKLAREAAASSQYASQKYQTKERRATEAFKANQNSRYKVTAASQNRLNTLKTFIQ